MDEKCWRCVVECFQRTFRTCKFHHGTGVDEYKRTALRMVADCADNKNVRCTLQLLCFGAEIDEKTIKEDRTKLLEPIESRLKLLRSGNRMGTSLLCDEENRRLWCVAFCFTWKYRGAAFKAYYKVRAFMTFHGIFMGPGYGVGKGSVWNRNE